MVAVVAVVALAATIAHRQWPPDAPVPTSAKKDPVNDTQGHVGVVGKAQPKKTEADSFLDEFTAQDSSSEKEREKPALTDAELEKRFQSLAGLSDQIAALNAELRRTKVPEIQASLAGLEPQYRHDLEVFENDVKQAKRARPNDAVPRWLTGELLMLAGGEPEEIAPHLEFAVKQGLRRPRLLASVARVRLEANRFDDAYRAAQTAIDHAGQDRYVWKEYGRIAFCSNRFDEVRDRLGRAFPTDPPEWVRKIRNNARDLQEQWDIELKRRTAEAKADDLPRVRLVIEHRRFARDASGNPLTTVESTGREEVLLELFENEAPAAVANFIELVASGFYDGTRFHLAVPAIMAAGGDPLTKRFDTSADGTGGPGYFIPDESKSPRARKHFRGSISMANNSGPHSAGSQFFFSLSPAPEADGRHTVFGRIIDGQAAVDHISRGRTTRKFEHAFGRLIPGDLLVRAEVVRKRNHEYRAVKE
jgi:cyclophilin family peptidyl-prolyl cis-trans isomerase